MMTYFDGAIGGLPFKRVAEASIVAANPQTIYSDYRSASSASAAPFPRIDAGAASRTYATWNDDERTFFDGEVVWPTSVQSTSLSVADIKLYPNPATDLVNISFTATENDKVSVSVMDISGRVLQTSAATVTQGANVIPVTLTNLPAGNYTLRINGTHTNTALLFSVAE
jgi:hypothetical protein